MAKRNNTKDSIIKSTFHAIDFWFVLSKERFSIKGIDETLIVLEFNYKLIELEQQRDFLNVIQLLRVLYIVSIGLTKI